jgi:hypothetical protein
MLACRALLAALALLIATVPAFAAMPNARPGLWETSSTLTLESPPPGIDQAKLSPKERERMAQAQPNAGKPVTTRDRVCMTADMLDRWEGFAVGGTGSCQRRVLERTPTRIRFTMACAQSAGEGEFSAVGSDRVVGNARLTMRNSKGDAKADVKLESRWISADCGGLKPGERQLMSR